ncbi:MAG: hypothetical protein IKL51_01930 [Lachnospiraceae bacterium]|nr:hypothetical protein [Lachnospiraceae bacterium]
MLKNNKEIGGYLNLDIYTGDLYHKDVLLLNTGRGCLRYLIQKRNIKCIWMPYFLCDTVIDACQKEKVDLKFYRINESFIPEKIELDENDWLYFINYYGQFSNADIKKIVNKYERVIVDSTHAFFQKPLENIDTIYSCRKFFGVSDGGLLSSKLDMDNRLIFDLSAHRMSHILGAFEKETSMFYKDFLKNEEAFSQLPPMRMSKLTENILRAIDYDKIKKKRTNNFLILQERLGKKNRLKLKNIKGGFMYPFWIKNGSKIRRRLIEKKIYIPVLWPNVLEVCQSQEVEYELANNILPLPIDQRYAESDMQYMAQEILKLVDNSV